MVDARIQSGWFEIQVVPHKLLIAVIAESSVVVFLRQMEV